MPGVSMPNPTKPAGMDRREFLQFAGSGLLFSMLATPTASAGAAEDATFASDGFSLTLHFPPGGGAVQLSSLRNPKTRFEWAVREPPSSLCLRQLGDPLRDGLHHPVHANSM